MNDKEKALVMKLLLDWKRLELSVMYEFSCDFDADKERIEKRFNERKLELGLA